MHPTPGIASQVRSFPAVLIAAALVAMSGTAPPRLMGQVSVAAEDSSPFRPLELPAPTAVRNGAGRPGAGYWQQDASYRIRATLDPEQNELRGRETIHYRNRSPDRLPYLWLFLEQNICAPNSVTNLLDQPPLVFLNSTFDFSCKGPRIRGCSCSCRRACT